MDGFIGMCRFRKTVTAVAATSSISSLTYWVVVAINDQVFGRIPPLLASNACLRFISSLKSSLTQKVIESMAVAMLLFGIAVTSRMAVIFFICSTYRAIGARHPSTERTATLVE